MREVCPSSCGVASAEVAPYNLFDKKCDNYLQRQSHIIRITNTLKTMMSSDFLITY